MRGRRTESVGCKVKPGGQARLTEKGTSGRDLRSEGVSHVSIWRRKNSREREQLVQRP